ncbi:PIN domain-containing protein [Phormidesmis priestleyi]|uniref:PIN domain-containing protein n=1 Tax=Phormidesmis priestleyi TaxID=268141 RepID=UPI00083B35EF|nr:PIN domain-containing protein [Phormidesmis priestleyi]
MLHLVLDTTALRSDPARKKAAFQSLTRLSQAMEVQIYIPYIVQQEFLSQEEDQYRTHLQKVISSIQSLQKRLLPEETVNFLKNSIESFKNTQSKLDNFSCQIFKVWCNETRTKILPIDVSHGQKVFDSYFQGISPFKKKKNREDFPDAFIWQAICDLSENLEELYVVTNDSVVNAALQNQEKIISVETLDNFIRLDICQKIIKELELEESRESNRSANFQRIISLLTSNKSAKSAVVISMEAELLGEFQGKSIKSFDIPDDNHEATVDRVGNIESLDLYIENISYYGSSTYVIPFSIKIEAQLSYFIYKADYWALDDEKAYRMSIDDWNDYTYSVDEEYSLAVEGRMSFMVDSDIPEQSNLSDEDLIEVIENAEITISIIDKVSVILYSSPD